MKNSGISEVKIIKSLTIDTITSVSKYILNIKLLIYLFLKPKLYEERMFISKDHFNSH